jgi:hypothetical protein
MAKALAHFVTVPRIAPAELARIAIVAGCALALILAAPLHF